MIKPENKSLHDDDLRAHNAELINSKFSDTLPESNDKEKIPAESENIIPGNQNKDTQA